MDARLSGHSLPADLPVRRPPGPPLLRDRRLHGRHVCEPRDCPAGDACWAGAERGTRLAWCPRAGTPACQHMCAGPRPSRCNTETRPGSEGGAPRGRTRARGRTRRARRRCPTTTSARRTTTSATGAGAGRPRRPRAAARPTTSPSACLTTEPRAGRGGRAGAPCAVPAASL